MTNIAQPVSAAGRTRLLIVDEDDAIRSACFEISASLGYQVEEVESLVAARALMRGNSIDIVLLDLKSPVSSGLALLEEIKTLYPETSVIVMTAFGTVASAVEAMRTGAADYLTKPFGHDDLAAVLDRACERRNTETSSRELREQLRTQQGLGNLIGRSSEMDKLYRILSKVALSSHPVLILGETGTGKELVARSIHAHGACAGKPFLPVDCGSVTPGGVESELFGYVKGASDGATRDKDGLLAWSGGGTLFLDEIGEMPIDLQAKLLRALQEKQVRPLGGTASIPITVRILAATSRDLTSMVEQGKFRKDLYYRLNIVNLRIPPLRERKEDIPLLAAHFLDRLGRENGGAHTLSDDALRTMMEYDWPGNVRELENSIERACTLSGGPVLHMGDLPSALQDFRMQGRLVHPHIEEKAVPAVAPSIAPTTEVTPLAELEKQAILTAIRRLNGDKLLAAKLLGIGKTTLYRKLKEYGISSGSELETVQ
jgi:two-component system response regulator HydG